MSLGSYLLGHTRRMLHITLWGKHLVTQLSQLQSLASGKASVCAHTRVVKIHLCQVHVRMCLPKIHLYHAEGLLGTKRSDGYEI